MNIPNGGIKRAEKYSRAMKKKIFAILLIVLSFVTVVIIASCKIHNDIPVDSSNYVSTSTEKEVSTDNSNGQASDAQSASQSVSQSYGGLVNGGDFSAH